LEFAVNTHSWRFVLAGCFVAAMVAPVQGYNPPTDPAGPIVARIEGPEEVTKTDAPLAVRVVLENRGEPAVSGTLELGVIDRWRVEPSGPVKFKVEGKSKATHEFKVTAGTGSYSAHYPIHAFARFEVDGKSLVAHPILIVKATLPAVPRTLAPLEFKPIRVRADSELALWRVPGRAVIAVFKEEPRTMPVGLQGSEERTGGSMHVRSEALAGQSREVVMIHPPWQQGLTGTLAAEYPIELPKSTPLTLSFANAMIPDGKGDGVTFRVRVAPFDAPAGQLGKIVFERHTAARTWQAATADLSAFAGQTVRLQLESHPGPKNDTGWDGSFWAEPLLVAGRPPKPAAFPPSDEEKTPVHAMFMPQSRIFSVWPGRRGLLDAAVGFEEGGKSLYFRGFAVRVLGVRIDDARSPMTLTSVKEEEAGNGKYRARHRFESPYGPFDLLGEAVVDEKPALRVRFWLENVPKPRPWQVVWLEDVAAGPWSEEVAQMYAGVGNVIRKPGFLRLAFDGHSLSSSFVGFDFAGGVSIVQGVDVPPDHLLVAPEQKHYSLHVPHASTLTFIPSNSVWQGVKTWRKVNGLKAAGGVRTAAGRFVFDLWGGRYDTTTAALRKAIRYGMTDAMVVFHDWQRWGYDYRLPDLYPPNPHYGTLEELRELAAVCAKAGIPFAPHDNYIDFYPDAEGFSYEKEIAFEPNGQPVRAWFNEGRKAQSYRIRADRVTPYLQRNLRWIREGIAPSAYFIDVWSSINPYDYWTADGQFFDRVGVRTSWGEHFAWIRNYLGNDAPQISESGHDQLVGWLDGAQTNHLRVGKPGPNSGWGSWCVWDVPHADAERVPWLDAAHHDRFVLHGAGYPGRYEGGLDPRLHGIYSDDYMATEVLTGHPGMVAHPFHRDVVRKYWLLSELMRGLALRTIDRVEFVGGDLHRQHVRWSGGAEVWVNRGASDWTVAGKTLPQYGFWARVPTESESAIEVGVYRDDKEKVIVESARSPHLVYVNGRQPVGGPERIRPTAQSVTMPASGRGELQIVWQADEPIPVGFVPFVHFCDEQKEIVFQGGHPTLAQGKTGRIEAAVSFSLPKDARAKGGYEVGIGLYDPKTGVRLELSGPDDGSRRIHLGRLVVESEGDRVTGLTLKRPAERPDPLLARLNPEKKAIDFGPIATAGGCRLSREGNALVVTPLPQPGKAKTAARIRWAALPWSIPQPTKVEVLAEDGRVARTVEPRRDGDAVLLDFEPDAFAYRLGSREEQR
jgi:hypothetical protein